MTRVESKRKAINCEVSNKLQCHQPAVAGFSLQPLEMYWATVNQEEITRILSSNYEWLNDNAIDAAQALLANQIAYVTGFQSTVIFQGSYYGSYATKDMPCVQIVNVNHHCICLSNHALNVVAPGIIYYYDSMYRKGSQISDVMKKISASLLYLQNNSSIIIKKT